MENKSYSECKNIKVDKNIMLKEGINISVSENKTKPVEKHKIIIIGATSGTHTAAFYSATANMEFITVMVPFKLKNIVEDDLYTIDYPGNPEGDSYSVMFEKTKKQCERFNCKMYGTENLKIEFNESEQQFIVTGNGIPVLLSEWLFYENMENMIFSDYIFSCRKAIEIKFSNDFSQMCANGCIAFKDYQLKK